MAVIVKILGHFWVVRAADRIHRTGTGVAGDAPARATNYIATAAAEAHFGGTKQRCARARRVVRRRGRSRSPHGGGGGGALPADDTRHGGINKDGTRGNFQRTPRQTYDNTRVHSQFKIHSLANYARGEACAAVQCTSRRTRPESTSRALPLKSIAPRISPPAALGYQPGASSGPLAGARKGGGTSSGRPAQTYDQGV